MIIQIPNIHHRHLQISQPPQPVSRFGVEMGALSRTPVPGTASGGSHHSAQAVARSASLSSEKRDGVEPT